MAKGPNAAADYRARDEPSNDCLHWLVSAVNCGLGGLMGLNLEWVFVGAGALPTLLSLSSRFSREVRSIKLP